MTVHFLLSYVSLWKVGNCSVFLRTRLNNLSVLCFRCGKRISWNAWSSFSFSGFFSIAHKLRCSAKPGALQNGWPQNGGFVWIWVLRRVCVRVLCADLTCNPGTEETCCKVFDRVTVVSFEVVQLSVIALAFFVLFSASLWTSLRRWVALVG